MELEQHESSTSKQKSKTNKRPRRPQITLDRGLTNLHVLLRVPSFSRWPLAVRFFSSDVHVAWEKIRKKTGGELRDGLRVSLDQRKVAPSMAVDGTFVDPQTGRKRKHTPSGVGGIEGLDVSYSSLQMHVRKSVRLLAEPVTKRCSVCANDLETASSMVVACPADECSAMFHMACITQQRSADSILPVSISCPHCRSEHMWVDLVKELSIRVRAGKDLVQLTRVPRKPNAAASLALVADSADTDAAGVVQRFENGLADIDHLTKDAEDDPLPDDWHKLDEDSDDQSVASTSTGLLNRAGSPVKPTKRRGQLPVVIEDSEWDSAEVLE